MLFHEPNATRNGIMAALLARENVRGSETALEGNAGFYTAFTGNNRGDLTYSFLGRNATDMAAVTDGLGSRWEVMHVTPKIYQTAGYNCPVIDLMTQIRSSHEIAPDTIESITIDMNWLETLYPSPEFPNPQRTSPGVGSTHYFAAYTCINGHYPPLKPRLDPGISSSQESRDVMDLMQRVYVVGHRDRPAFAPRITIEVAEAAPTRASTTAMNSSGTWPPRCAVSAPCSTTCPGPPTASAPWSIPSLSWKNSRT